MHRIVFYTWQSDLPNATNRSFIQTALENAAKAITADDTVDIEPVVDRDTQGVAGSPDIAKTIFQKIGAADVVVADVSIIGITSEGRATPNPNVLIELGFALDALGDERVILVFNTAFGRIEQLPFDLKMRRVVPYDMPKSVTERAPERKELEAKLNAALRAALGSIKPEPIHSPLAEAIAAIQQMAPNRTILVRDAWAELLKRLEAKKPKSVADGATSNDIEQTLLSTAEDVFDYARLTDTIAVINDGESARAVYRGFGRILERCELPPGFSGTLYPADFDFWKFHGHELFTAFTACLIREDRWELMSTLLDESIPVAYHRATNGPGYYAYTEFAKQLEVVRVLNQERQRVSVHADILRARYAPECPLGLIITFADFVAADFFLFLRDDKWRPWSAVFLSSAPRFVRAARSAAVANRIVKALNLPDVETLRRSLNQRAVRLEQIFQSGWWDQPFAPGDITSIGTER